MTELVPARKSVVVAVVLAVFFGLIAAHRFYLGQLQHALMTLAGLAGAIFIAAIAPGWGSLAVFVYALWLLADCLTMPDEIRRMNDEAEAETVMRAHGLGR